MATTPNAFVPELLEKHNYSKWSVWMRRYFVAQGLWDVVDPNGSTASENPSSNYKKNNAKALYAITTSCGDIMFNKIKAVDTARDVWIKLKEEALPSVPDSVSEPVETGFIDSHHAV